MPSQQKDTANGTPPQQKDTGFLEAFRQQSYQELAKRIIRWIEIIIVAVIGGLALWLCGIKSELTKVQEKIDKIQEKLSATEDTIFSYKYEYFPRHARGSPEAVLRTFYFSAASETEVTLLYRLRCNTRDGKGWLKVKELPEFAVSVNSYEVKSAETPVATEWNKCSLTKEDLEGGSDVIPTIWTSSKHPHRQHQLLLEFPDSVNAEKISHCTFDAMVFVRDMLLSPEGEEQ